MFKTAFYVKTIKYECGVIDNACKIGHRRHNRRIIHAVMVFKGNVSRKKLTKSYENNESFRETFAKGRDTTEFQKANKV
jgi:hypothetical protein